MSEFYKNTDTIINTAAEQPKVSLDKDNYKYGAERVEPEVYYDPEQQYNGIPNNVPPNNMNNAEIRGAYRTDAFTGMGGSPYDRIQGAYDQSTFMNGAQPQRSPDFNNAPGYGGTAYAETAGYPDVRVDNALQCRSCGRVLENGMRFCPFCGADSMAAQQQYNTNQTNANFTQNINQTYIFPGSDAPHRHRFSTVPFPGAKRRNKWVFFILSFLVGVTGAQHFYEGRIGKGLAYLFTGGLFTIGWIIDIVIGATRLLNSGDDYYID